MTHPSQITLCGTARATFREAQSGGHAEDTQGDLALAHVKRGVTEGREESKRERWKLYANSEAATVPQALHWECTEIILLNTHNDPKKCRLASQFVDQETDKSNEVAHARSQSVCLYPCFPGWHAFPHSGMWRD